MKKILATAFCLTTLFAYNSILKTNNAVSVLSEDVEALSACEVNFTDANGNNVTYECVGEKGTCIIDEHPEVKVFSKVVKASVYASCSGSRKSS